MPVIIYHYYLLFTFMQLTYTDTEARGRYVWGRISVWSTAAWGWMSFWEKQKRCWTNITLHYTVDSTNHKFISQGATGSRNNRNSLGDRMQKTDNLHVTLRRVTIIREWLRGHPHHRQKALQTQGHTYWNHPLQKHKAHPAIILRAKRPRSLFAQRSESTAEKCKSENGNRLQKTPE